jgi:hypothetical protein
LLKILFENISEVEAILPVVVDSTNQKCYILYGNETTVITIYCYFLDLKILFRS